MGAPCTDCVSDINICVEPYLFHHLALGSLDFDVFRHYLESINQSRTDFVDDWSIRQKIDKLTERNADENNKLYHQIRFLELDVNNLKSFKENL